MSIIFVSDFYCNSDNSISLLTPDCTMYNDNNQSANSDTESERHNDDLLEEEVPELITSLESSEQNLSLSQNTNINNTLNDISNKIYPNMSNSTNSLITDINSTILSNNNDLDDNYLNNRESIDVSSVLDSPPESVNSKDRRYFSTLV